MKYVSTRGGESVDLARALADGIAADGGLYLPTHLPTFNDADFSTLSMTSVARTVLAPFFAGSVLEPALEPIVEETFGFDVPLRDLPAEGSSLQLLELFHGPTAAFKDVGAGFLAACMSRLESGAEKPLTILVATSGDTGGAVAAAFDQRDNIRVVVLFPDGRVSDRQAHQLSCWSDNVLSLAVSGTFDDCQALVKAAMTDSGLRQDYRFSSANSINIGRLLPQCTYYAYASLLHYRATGRKPGFIVPTGNLGNGLACVLARQMGLPVGPIVLATNANRTIADYLISNDWQPRDSVATLASAMDVGNPSNMERLRELLGDANVLREHLTVHSYDDDAIREGIRQDFESFDVVTCPHTAIGTQAWRGMTDAQATDWIVVATAHPAKFETIVEPIIGQSVEVPEALAAVLSRPSRAVKVEADLNAVAAAMRARFGDDA